MERDVAEERPAKRRREGQRDSDIEGDSDSIYNNSEESEDFQNYPFIETEGRKPWMKHEIVPA
eukprot:3017277-Heterocapsa_arctica.AAC.1